jgi:hypothetical protein
MVSVTARKIRDHGNERASVGVGRLYTGYLISYPAIGRGMVIFRDPHGHRMITTPVKRILGEPGGKRLYVETENSVYRLEIHGEPMQSSVRAASPGAAVASPSSSSAH